MRLPCVQVLIIFIFSILGMHIFGRLKYGDVIGPNANFETVPMGMLTLFGFATVNAHANLRGDHRTACLTDCMWRL